MNNMQLVQVHQVQYIMHKNRIIKRVSLLDWQRLIKTTRKRSFMAAVSIMMPQQFGYILQLSNSLISSRFIFIAYKVQVAVY